MHQARTRVRLTLAQEFHRLITDIDQLNDQLIRRDSTPAGQRAAVETVTNRYISSLRRAAEDLEVIRDRFARATATKAEAKAKPRRQIARA